jgi:hypothetical protein
LDDKRKIDKKDELHRFQMEEDKVSSEWRQLNELYLRAVYCIPS